MIMSLTNQTRMPLLFSTPRFLRLARYMPHVGKAREEDLKEGKIDQAEYDRIESLDDGSTLHNLRLELI